MLGGDDGGAQPAFDIQHEERVRGFSEFLDDGVVRLGPFLPPSFLRSLLSNSFLTLCPNSHLLIRTFTLTWKWNNNSTLIISHRMDFGSSGRVVLHSRSSKIPFSTWDHGPIS